jgi:hypothetical protein
MIEYLILSTAIGALGATLTMSEPYTVLLNFLRLNFKPFNCPVCLSYWAVFITGLLWNPVFILFAGVAALAANLTESQYYKL